MDQVNDFNPCLLQVHRRLQTRSRWEVVPAAVWGLHWGNRLWRSAWYPCQPDGVWRPFLRIQQPHQREHLWTDPQGHIQVSTWDFGGMERVGHCSAICTSAGKHLAQDFQLPQCRYHSDCLSSFKERERETFSLFSAQPPYSLFLNFIHLRIQILRSMYVCIFGKSLLSTGMTGLYVWHTKQIHRS